LPLVAFLLSASAEGAQGLGATVDQDGGKVILLPDHTWRYDDAGGERCTPVGPKVEVCALPSVWSPVPGDRGFEPQWFEQGTDFRATVWLLGGPGTNVALTTETVRRFINGDRGKDTDHGLTAEETKTELAGLRPITLSSVIGTTTTRVYSYVALTDGSVLLAVTVEDPSFQYSFSHRTAHAGFLDAIRGGGGK
jgi:hypothetical protein